MKQGSDTSISESACHIKPENDAVTDFRPIRTVMIQIFELDLNLVVLKASNLQHLSLSDGDTFSFTSIVATEPQTIPGGLQLHIVSENASGDLLYNDWIVSFTNKCGIEPFTMKDSIGWSEIVSCMIFPRTFILLACDGVFSFNFFAVTLCILNILAVRTCSSA